MATTPKPREARRARAGVLIGTAGWSLPLEQQHRFAAAGTHLERYARVFHAAEINSTFHRSHRASTYERWAASVPDSFRFSVKVPRAITHERRLVDADGRVEEFLQEIRPLGARVGCLLVQLPPKLELDARVARAFFKRLSARFAGPVAVEPRHASWFTPAAQRMLETLRIARVAADPPRAAGGMDPGGWAGMAYFRLHGFPRVYYSSYDGAFLEALAQRLRSLDREGIPCWCVFDNTTLGAGAANALSLQERLG